MIHIAPKS